MPSATLHMNNTIFFLSLLSTNFTIQIIHYQFNSVSYDNFLLLSFLTGSWQQYIAATKYIEQYIRVEIL